MSGSAAHIVALIDKMKGDLIKDGGVPGHIYMSPDILTEIQDQVFDLQAYPDFTRPYRLTRFMGLEVHVEPGSRRQTLMISEKPIE